MIQFNSDSEQMFILDGISHYRKFFSNVRGSRIRVYNAYNPLDVLVDYVEFTDISVNGVVYPTIQQLQINLLGVIYNGAVGTGTDFNQDNVFIPREITYSGEGSEAEFANRVNQLQPFTVGDKQLAIFTAVNPSQPILKAKKFVFVIAKTGKGNYGSGQTQLTADNIFIASITQPREEDIIGTPTTQFVDFGVINEGETVSTRLNSSSPAIVLQDQSSGYVVFKTVIGGNPINYLFLATGGTYGLGQQQSTLDDFLQITDWFQDNEGVEEAPNDGFLYGRKNKTWSKVDVGTIPPTPNINQVLAVGGTATDKQQKFISASEPQYNTEQSHNGYKVTSGNSKATIAGNLISMDHFKVGSRLDPYRLKFIKDKTSLELSARDNIDGAFQQEFQAKSGIVALLSDITSGGVTPEASLINDVLRPDNNQNIVDGSKHLKFKSEFNSARQELTQETAYGIRGIKGSTHIGYLTNNTAFDSSLDISQIGMNFSRNSTQENYSQDAEISLEGQGGVFFNNTERGTNSGQDPNTNEWGSDSLRLNTKNGLLFRYSGGKNIQNREVYLRGNNIADGETSHIIQLPRNNGNLPIEINGIKADAEGKITIPTGSSQTIDQTLQIGSVAIEKQMNFRGAGVDPRGNALDIDKNEVYIFNNDMSKFATFSNELINLSKSASGKQYLMQLKSSELIFGDNTGSITLERDSESTGIHVNKLPENTGYLVASVNGVKPDKFGNVVVEGGSGETKNLQQVLTAGSVGEVTTDITLEKTGKGKFSITDAGFEISSNAGANLDFGANGALYVNDQAGMSFDARNSKLTFSASDKGVAFSGANGSSMNLGIGGEGVKIEGGGNNVQINAGGTYARVNIVANDGLHSDTNIHAQAFVRSNLFGSYREEAETPTDSDMNIQSDQKFNVQAKDAFNINGFNGQISLGSYSYMDGENEIIGLQIRGKNTVSVSGKKVQLGNGESLIEVNGFPIDFKYGGEVMYKGSLRNEAGQVKVNYTGLDTTGFVADTLKVLNINLANPTLSPYPTTIFPNSTPNDYSGIFDNTRGELISIGRLIENPIDGQVHTWRFQFTYSGKASGSNGSLDLILTNPVSGFQYTMPFTLPSGRTTGSLNSTAITIADNNSTIPPNGYILQAMSSFTDINLKLEINSITRISQAIEVA